MKPSMNLFKPVVLASCISIAACGGGGSSTPPPEETTTTLSGKVADGYLNGATVCLDLNMNKKCDAGEPSGTSGAGGSFNISATQAQIDSYPLVVDVVVGTVDEDTNTAISKPYIMSAPVGSTFVSPLTTMVQNKIDKNPALTSSAAEALVIQDLGSSSTVSLFEDYISAKLDANNSNASEYATLHNIAQVSAAVMADNYELVTQASAAANVEIDILLRIIVDSLEAELGNIVTSVENAGQNFDADAVVSISGNISNTDISTLADTIEQVRNEQTTAASDLLAVLKTGITWFDTVEGGYEYGTISADSNNKVNEVIYEHDSGSDSWNDISPVEGNGDTVLSSIGWADEYSPNRKVTVESDGSLSFTDFSDLEKFNAITEVDISGDNIANISLDLPGEAVDQNATFSTGAVGYRISVTTRDFYGIGYWNDGQCQILSSSGNGTNCVSVNDINSMPAQSLTSTIGHELSLGDDLSYTLEGVGTDTSGIVSYRKVSTDTQLTASTWSRVTINGEELIVFNIPADVQPLTFDFDATKAFHTVYDGYARLGWFQAGKTFEAFLFNSIAKQDILSNFLGESSSGPNEVPLSGEYFFDGTELGMLVFYPNGYYLHWQSGSNDINCSETNPKGGVEYGTYSYDGTNFSATQVYDENASCGLNDFNAGINMTINSNGSLTLDNGTSPAITGQNMDGGSGSIEGAWGAMPNVNSPGAIVFFPNGRFMIYALDSANPDCDGVTNPGGVEYGTYSYDGSTITGNVEVDENGNCGINNGTGSFTLPNVTVTGDQVTVVDTAPDGGAVTFNRL